MHKSHHQSFISGLFEKYSNKATLAVIAWALAANILLLYCLLELFSGIKNVDDTWQKNAQHSIKKASLLAEIERNMGYVGFIHHFKNYIIRGTDTYFDDALTSYHANLTLLDELQEMTSTDEDKKNIENIRTVLNQYHKKLLLAKTINTDQPVKSLDKLVRVDDSKAGESLNELRRKLAKTLEEKTITTNKIIREQKKLTEISAIILFPIFIFSTIFTVRLINNLKKFNTELSAIFKMSPDGIIFSNLNGEIIRSNKVVSNIFGYTSKELQKLTIEDLIHNSIRKDHTKYRNGFLKNEESRNMNSLKTDIKGKKKSGESVDLNIAISSKLIHGAMHSVCIIRDKTEHNQLKDQAEHDHLTSTNNRRTIEKLIQKEIFRSNRLNNIFSLLLVDIDNFKDINDTLGHPAGDEAIKIVAKFLESKIRAYDHLGRWGGDEFMILCPELNKEESVKFSERIRRELQEYAQQKNLKITLSIGVSTSSDNADLTFKKLIKDTDLALYQAKNYGRNQVIHASQINTA